MKRRNRRQRLRTGLLLSGILLAAVCVTGFFCTDAARVTDFSRKNIAPCLLYPFGTDWMGRDMLARTLKGLSMSMLLGMAAASVSACIALVLGVSAAVFGKAADSSIGFLIDLMMGIPHILLLILVSVALGKGWRGVAWGIALTHWPSLARLIRAEVIQLKESPYIQIAEKLGKRKWYLVRKHMLPHLIPQFLVGLVLLFPHAILHESAVTFLGFGLDAGQPAIGIILSESMQYLVTGKWWLALFPGAMLMLMVILFYETGEALRKLTDPFSVHE